MRRKLFAILLCVCMAFVFTACGGSSDGSSETSDGSDLVGKWQIKAIQDTNSNSPVSLADLKADGSVDSDYEMIIQIDKDLNCTIFNGTRSTSEHPVELTDNGDGSFRYSAKDDSGFNVWVEENTVDFINGDTVLCYSSEGKEVGSYFEKMKDNGKDGSEESSLDEYVLKEGDTKITDDYEFTLNSVELSYEVLPTDTSSGYTSYPADSGKVYIDVQADVKNLMQRDICIDELYTCTAKYDGEYKYTGFPIVDTGNSFDWVDSYTAATPLETAKTHYLIECPKEVDTSDKSLTVSITLADGTTYSYIVR